MDETKSKEGTGVRASPFNPIKAEIILWLAFGLIIWGTSEKLAPQYTLGSLLLYALCFSLRILYATHRVLRQQQK